MKTEYSFIIDFSFDGEKLFIFELGDFFTSSLSRLDRLRREGGSAPLKEEYMTKLRSTYPNAIYLNTETFPSNKITFHDFSDDHYEQYYFRSKSTIETLLEYSGRLGQLQEFNRPVIATLDYLPTFYARTILAPLASEKFKLLNYPRGVLREVARDKTVFHAFTKESSLCPETVLLDLRRDDVLVNLNTFFEQHKGTHYVIKPTNLTQGMGVSIVTQGEAKILIQKLCQAMRIGSSIEVDGWSASFAKANYFALLQTCVPSKEILFEDKPYRPTGRVVITATFNDNHSLPVLTCLGGYWELPKQSVIESFSASSLVSPDGHCNDCIVLPIDQKDWLKINEEINHHLPSILLEMYNTPLLQLDKKFKASLAMQAYSKYLGLDELSLDRQPKQILLTSDLVQNIACLFKNLEYCSFNVIQKSGHFQKAMIAYSGYVDEIKKIDPPSQTIVRSKLPTKEPENLSSSRDSNLKRKSLIECRRHEVSICLLSRHNSQLLGYFFFCTGILSLISGIITQRESLLTYGMFGILAGAYANFVCPQKTEVMEASSCQIF